MRYIIGGVFFDMIDVYKGFIFIDSFLVSDNFNFL